jgi:hypothetical protein
MIHSYWVMLETSLKHGVKAGLFYLMPRLSNLMEHQNSMTGEMEVEKSAGKKFISWTIARETFRDIHSLKNE